MTDATHPDASASSQLVLGDPDQTMEMKVANLGFLLDRLGEDCDDLQYLRELTQNSLEAQATKVHWDVDWLTFEMTGRYKLCCIDNGVGMTGEEMVKHINHLSSSGRTQAMDANFGVGAKISAATRNPAGVVYQSWVNGRGYMVQLWRDPETDQYGLKQFRLPNGTFSHVVSLSDKATPAIIDQHGTKVVLLGRGQNHDTMTAPEGTATPSRWVNRYLGSRYFRFPEVVEEVKSREGWTNPTDDTERNLLRSALCMSEFLERFSDSRGVVNLPGCDVHWWILDDSEARKSYSLPNAGHFAALYQDELYELTAGRGGTARLQQFGVIFGSDRVVLYAEPKNGTAQRLHSNTARTQLLLDGDSLPYPDWAGAFRQAMPQEIRDHMDAVIAGARDASHRQAIQERLKNYAKLYRLSRRRIRPGGPDTVTGSLHPSHSRERDESTTDQEKPRKPRPDRDPTGDDLASMLAAEGLEAEPTEDMEPAFPDTVWISVRDEPPTRAEDELDDRAAKYLPDDNLIQINGDFRVFVDMIYHWCREYELPRDHEVVESIVREWFEQALIETVIGAQALQGDRRWTTDDIEKLLSEEALTAAVMQRYHVANAIKRSLGAKLGTLRDRVEVSA